MNFARLATLPACLALALALAGPAHAGFVPALGSPFAVDPSAQAIAVTDADRSGTFDVVAGALQLLSGRGTGSLLPAQRVAPLGALDGLAATDMTGDGLADFAVIAHGTPDRLLLFVAGAGGSYSQILLEDDIGDATGLVAGDVNRDGAIDLVVARDAVGDNVSVLRNAGAAQFVRQDYAAGTDPLRRIAVGDFTGDGWLDVVVGSSLPDVSVLVNDRDGTLAPGIVAATGGGGAAEAVAPADMTGDGRLDLVVTDGLAGIVVLRGNGAGGLTPVGPPTPIGATPPASVDVGDVDADGRVDVVAGAKAGGRVAYLAGDGLGGLRPVPGSPFSTGDLLAGPVGQVLAIDMNRDGQSDVVTANGSGSVSVLLNSDTGLLEAIPGSINFGSMPARSTAVTRSVTLRSTRGRVRIGRVAAQGSGAFVATPGICTGRILIVGESCTVDVTFTPPRRAGRTAGSLTVDANAAALIVPLVGAPRPPLLTGVRVRPKRATARRGVKLAYRLSEPGRVQVRVERALDGRRVAGRCRPLSRSNASRRHCIAWARVSTLSRRGRTGANAIRLRSGVLTPGENRLGLSVSDRFRNRSKEQRVRFEVLAPPPPEKGRRKSR